MALFFGHWVVFIATLTQTTVTWEEGLSVEELPRTYWLYECVCNC